MLSGYADKFRNPHEIKVHELINSLICYENDYQRADIDLRNSPNEVCIKNRCQSIRDEAKECFQKYHMEKQKFKEYHEKSIDHIMRCAAIQNDDKAVVKNCEKDINVLNKQFAEEVSYIQKCDSVLGTFFNVLNDEKDGQLFSSECCFKNFEWIPEGKSLNGVDTIVNEIKTTMGPTLINAFAQLHIHQPSDAKSFLASYLMNLEHNEEIMREKLQLFELHK